MQDLWQPNYRILSIILQKELIKSNVNMGMIITHVKTVESNTKIMSAVLNKQTLKMI